MTASGRVLPADIGRNRPERRPSEVTTKLGAIHIAHVCRTVALGVIEERTKNRGDRFVLLNARAMHALEFARADAERRKMGVGKVTETPYVFPPSKKQRVHKVDLRPAPPMAPRSEGFGSQLSAAI